MKHNFSLKDTAVFYQCSSKTISHCLKDLYLQQSVEFTAMSDHQLDTHISTLLDQYPNVGYRSVLGHLCREGLRVQWYRVLESLHRIDPDGVQERLKVTINWRKYNVPGPNCLWHIDGYHKLIRYQTVIHGDIDGYSRLPVYVRATNNNRSQTVLNKL